jgi:hypothetical protein
VPDLDRQRAGGAAAGGDGLPNGGEEPSGDEYSETTGRANGKQPPLPPGVKSFTDLRPAKTVLPARPPEG